ncbi:MAG: 16S rRNA (guanine(527)-N(7))-methyltransferase RsmG [Spartobacteria bacterium]|nr:16S rRNA (guanine(527)-N(7))-methyltransferase RsmG [Spartobacteria bacterium]
MTSPAPARFMDACADHALPLSQDRLDALSAYLTMLLAVNRQVNLTAVRDRDEAWMRHIFDSLLLWSHLPEQGCVLDVGSGGGLPAIPLAICCPHVRFTLLEATGKKARFLEQAKKTLALDNVGVVNARAETLAHDMRHREQYDRVTARAVAVLRVLLELTAPFLKPGACLLAMKGRGAEQELEEAQHAMDALGVVSFQTDRLGDQGAVLLTLRKTTPTPSDYPRRPGIPNKRPL